MGMYTRCCCSIKVNSNEFLAWWKKSKEYVWPGKPQPFNGHKFFTTDRWDMLLFNRDASYFSHQMTPVSEIRDGYLEDEFYLTIDNCIKNYDDEIELFYDLISSFTTDEILGFSEYEESAERTYYKRRGEK